MVLIFSISMKLPILLKPFKKGKRFIAYFTVWFNSSNFATSFNVHFKTISSVSIEFYVIFFSFLSHSRFLCSQNILCEIVKDDCKSGNFDSNANHSIVHANSNKCKHDGIMCKCLICCTISYHVGFAILYANGFQWNEFTLTTSLSVTSNSTFSHP